MWYFSTSACRLSAAMKSRGYSGRIPSFIRRCWSHVTGYDEEEDRRRAQEAGFDEHLVKPASAGSLQQLFIHPNSGAANDSLGSRFRALGTAARLCHEPTPGRFVGFHEFEQLLGHFTATRLAGMGAVLDQVLASVDQPVGHSRLNAVGP